MKKLFLFLAMASTTMFVSCGSDDSDGGSSGATSITLSSNLTTIGVGQSVTFTVTDNLENNVTSTSTFTANGVELDDNTFTPTTEGAYTIVATNGDLTSQIVITVTGPVVNAITLSASLTTIEVGQSVTFTVTDNLTNDVTSTSTFTANDVAFTGPTYAFTTAGTFNVVAKNGDLTSAAVVVTVTAPVVAAGKYTFGGEDYEVHNMFFRAHSASGTGVTVLNFGTEEAPDYRSLWMGVSYNGPEADIATATHYFQYYFTIPVLYDGTAFTLQFPGDAEAALYDVYADYDQVPFDLSTVDGAVITFNEFEFDETSASSDNAAEFTAGSSTLLTHEFDGDLTSEITAVGLTNLLGEERRTSANKSFPAAMIQMKDIKKVIPASKAKVQSFKAKR